MNELREGHTHLLATFSHPRKFSIDSDGV